MQFYAEAGISSGLADNPADEAAENYITAIFIPLSHSNHLTYATFN